MNKDDYEMTKNEELPEPMTEAYYDRTVVRRNFFIAAIIYLILIPIDQDFKAFYLVFGVFNVLGIILLAAFTGSKSKIIVYIDTVVSALFFIVFEYLAIADYNQHQTVTNYIFLLRQVLAVVFLITMYISIRTIQDITKK